MSERIHHISHAEGSQETVLQSVSDFLDKCQYEHGSIGEVLGEVEMRLSKLETSIRIPNESGLVLIGGGSGTPMVARSLQAYGISNFSLLANTGEMGKDKETGESIAGRLIFDEVPDAIDVMDILKQCTLSTPEARMEMIHRLLLREGARSMLHGYVVLQALMEKCGDKQKGIDLLGSMLNNNFRVLPSTLDRAELHLRVDGEDLDSNSYGARPNPHIHAEFPFFNPSASISEHARNTISSANTIVIGPGDVFFSVLPHWGVVGFGEELEKNNTAKLILIGNLTARRGDTTDFTIRDYLDLYDRFLPRDREVIALINTTNIVDHITMVDDLGAISKYGRYSIVKGQFISSQLSQNGQPLHDEYALGRTLEEVI